MKLTDNVFNDVREIKGFSKEDILDIKRNIEKLKIEKPDSPEIDDFLKTKFQREILNYYSNYFEEIRDFTDIYLTPKDNSEKNNFHNLKSGILKEIKLYSNNLLNLKLNCRNIKRLLKQNSFLDEFLITIQSLIDEFNELYSELEKSQYKYEGLYDNISYIWIEANKIKNLNLKINEFPSALTKWNEIKELYDFIEDSNREVIKKKKKKKKGVYLTLYFADIYQFYNKKQDGKIEIYSDLIFLLFQNTLIEEVKEVEDIDEYVNIVDRKEIIQKLKKFIHPIIKSLIENKLKAILDEINELDKNFTLEEDKKKINLKTVLEQKVSVYLPQIADYYLSGLEKKYHATISDLKEYDEFKNVIKYYSEKVDIFYSLVEELNRHFGDFESSLEPYGEITSSYEKIIDNVLTEITRRKEEYLYYLKSVRKERLRDHVRNFIYEKISEVNDLMSKYQDETALIVREEFPQLKQIREILSKYKSSVKKIKNDVYKKIDLYKEKDIDIYQIIKQWEDNFNFKKQQLTFLLSMILNKLFKNFKELIEEEDLMLERITEITDQKDTTDAMPLNFALSTFLFDKLTEEELNERITEIKSRVKNLSNEIDLYRTELTNLEITLSERVKVREGITSDKIKCGVCHKKFDFAKEQIIKCPFCEAVYHYLCVAFWLSKYNSCPACQNQFLDPNAGIYSDQEDMYKED
ncbi:MAG: hypothetical protein ACFFDO_00245 [Candidatus Thorarchaeota archaeon]